MIPLGLIAAILATGTDAEEAFRAGVSRRDNDLAARPLFRRAAESFAKRREQQPNNASLHKNEAHAWLLAGEIPAAIRAYRRGLAAAPDDLTLRQGLEYARSRVEYASPTDRSALSPRRESLVWLKRPLRLTGWLGVAAVSGCGWLVVTRWTMTRSRGRWPGMTLILAATAWAGWLILDARTRAGADAILVVTARPVMLRAGDGPSFWSRRPQPLPAGVEASALGINDGWVQVELAGGDVGWLPRDAVLGLETYNQRRAAGP
jgi:hypothetical protein